MTKEEILEEIRALLREPLRSTVEKPWTYTDIDLTLQIRSALRHLRVLGLASTIRMGVDGSFTEDPPENIGVAISLFVAASLLGGDLVRKLTEGELGIYLNAGGDVIDTKTATIALKEAARQYQNRLQEVLILVLAQSVNETDSVYTGPTS